MADYIDREALTKRLTRNLNACNPGTFSEGCYADAIETVKHFPAADVEPVRRWIPCSKALPNTRERVLATDGVFVGEMCINKRGQWQRYNIANYETLMSLDILAWMPLPEPPEMDGGGEDG